MKNRLGTSIVILSCLGLSAVAIAQPKGFNQEQMMQMMQTAQQMQTCMEKMDQNALQTLEKDAEVLEKKVKTLCQAGKRNEAQDSAIAFGMRIAKDKNIQLAKECGKMAEGMMPGGMMPAMDYPVSEKELEGKHVCDAYKKD